MLDFWAQERNVTILKVRREIPAIRALREHVRYRKDVLIVQDPDDNVLDVLQLA
jgi:hypothetical protein